MPLFALEAYELASVDTIGHASRIDPCISFASLVTPKVACYSSLRFLWRLYVGRYCQKRSLSSVVARRLAAFLGPHLEVGSKCGLPSDWGRGAWSRSFFRFALLAHCWLFCALWVMGLTASLTWLCPLCILYVDAPLGGKQGGWYFRYLCVFGPFLPYSPPQHRQGMIFMCAVVCYLSDMRLGRKLENFRTCLRIKR